MTMIYGADVTTCSDGTGFVPVNATASRITAYKAYMPPSNIMYWDSNGTLQKLDYHWSTNKKLLLI